MPDQDKIEFKMLDSKLIGSDTVVFRLEDGAMVKVRLGIERAGVAVNFRNPDGTQHYNIGINTQLTVTPAEKRFTVNKDQMPATAVSPPKKDAPYG